MSALDALRRLTNVTAGYWLMLALMSATASGAAADQGHEVEPLMRRLHASVVQVQMENQKTWTIRITGQLVRPPGLYLVVLNAQGHVVHHCPVPWGQYTADRPWELTLDRHPEDHEYVIRFVGSLDNQMGLQLPLTDVAKEVYADRYPVIPYPMPGRKLRRHVAFQVRPQVTELSIQGGGTSIRLLDETGQVMLDTRSQTDSRILVLKPQPGRTYWIDPLNAMYLFSSEVLFMAFDTQRLFVPMIDWQTMQSSPWWKEIQP